jgi:hypothetical protein
MHGLPKIVLERLKGKPVADQQGRQSAIDNRQSPMGDRQSAIDNRQSAVGDRQSAIDNRQSAMGDRQPTVDNRKSKIENQPFPHPDANLLAAFVEKTLSEKERTQVLNHLAQCAECREVASLTLPREVEVAQPASLTARRWRSAWPTLRWVALAGALAAVAFVVVLRPYPSRRPETVSKETRPTLMARASQVPPQPPAQPSAQPSAKAPVEKEGLEHRQSPYPMAQLKKGAGLAGGQQLAALPAGAEVKETTKLMAAARPPAPAQVENAPLNSRRYEALKSLTANPAAAVPPAAPPPPSPQSGFKQWTGPEAPPKAAVAAESQAGASVVPSAAQSVGVTADLKSGLVGGVPAPSSAPSALRKETLMRAKAQSVEVNGMAFRAVAQSAAAQPAALWTISPEGKVQRSGDGGKTWEEVRVDDKVTFRAIQAMGKEVWAGGSGGALYHSIDGGATWKRVNLISDGSSATEAIVLINSPSHDAQHVTVKTASGEQWNTEDGGLHWQREP